MTTTNEVREVEWVGIVVASSSLNLNFEVYDVDDLFITEVVDDTCVETPMILDTNYSLEAGTNGKPPVITNTTEIETGSRWIIRRRSKTIQDLNLSGTKLPFESLENVLDRLAIFAADIKGELDRCYKIPDGETADAANSKVDIIESRKDQLLVWDSMGVLSHASGTVRLAADLTLDSRSLLKAANYNSMRALLDVISNPTSLQGSLIARNAEENDNIEVLAPSSGGYCLMGNQDRSPETNESIQVAPVYRTPWCHPLSEVQGFELTVDASDSLNTISIGRGVTPPMFETGAAGQLATYSGSENKEIRLIDSLGATGRYRKKINGTWVAGDNEGGLAEGESIPSGGGNNSVGYDELYVFAMGRSNDDVFDIGFDTNIEGTNLAADSNVIAWAGTSGTQKLFLRRVRTVLLKDSELVPQHTYGPKTFFPHFNFMLIGVEQLGEFALGIFGVQFRVPTPGEDSMVDLTFDWKPNQLGFEEMTLRTNYQPGRKIMYEHYSDGTGGSFANEHDRARHIISLSTMVTSKQNSGGLGGIHGVDDGTLDIFVKVRDALTQIHGDLEMYLESWYDPRGVLPNEVKTTVV